MINAAVESESDDKESPLLLGKPLDIRLDWWITDGRNNMLKTWAGNQDSRKMFSKWEQPLREILSEEDFDINALFRQQRNVQGPYGFDCKFGWDALSVGFSLNEHTRYRRSVARPVVEILGAIGLQRFTPDIDRSKGIVRYATWETPLPPSVAGLVAVGALPHAALMRLEAETTRRGSYKGLATARIKTGDLDD